MKLLLISNSTNAGEKYLNHPKNEIKKFLGNEKINAIFIPYAGVTFSYQEYEDKVNERFNELGHSVTSIHKFDNPVEAIKNADAIVVGGGNTFELVNQMYKNKLMEPIKEKIASGTPFIGWSAGSNVACPTIRTTNDMPIVEPESFNVLNFVPFQINPHYLDASPEGHAGETREMRLEEFLELNKSIYVVGLREGTMLWIENNNIKLIGPKPARIFKHGQEPKEMTKEENFDFLLEN